MARRAYTSPVAIGPRVKSHRTGAARRLSTVFALRSVLTFVLSCAVERSQGRGEVKERCESGRGVELRIHLDLGL
jgi:hypothetical protein